MIKHPQILPTTANLPDGRLIVGLQYADDETIIACGYEYSLKDKPSQPTTSGNWQCQPTQDKSGWEWVEVPTPAPSTTVTVENFRKRFTDAELLAALTSTNNNVKMLMFKLTTVSQIDLSDAAVIAGVQYLLTAGILASQQRVDEVLG